MILSDIYIHTSVYHSKKSASPKILFREIFHPIKSGKPEGYTFLSKESKKKEIKKNINNNLPK
jgi:hypothetical protein